MNLKEAYTYANRLEDLYSTAINYLTSKTFITNTTQKHLRSKSNPEVADETIVVEKPNAIEFTPSQVVDFAIKLIDEKENLANAIAAAKSKAEINVDNAISINKSKQRFMRVLTGMANIKSTTTRDQSSDFRFNVNNEQVRYYYPVENIVSIDFDRNNVRNLAKKYAAETEKVSATLDSIVINTQIEFTPTFDINDTFEDLVMA